MHILYASAHSAGPILFSQLQGSSLVFSSVQVSGIQVLDLEVRVVMLGLKIRSQLSSFLALVFCSGAGLGRKVTRHAPGVSKMES